MKIRKSMNALIRTKQYCHIEVGCELEYDSETDEITSKAFIERVDKASTRLDKRLTEYWLSMHDTIEQQLGGKIAEIKHGEVKSKKR